tara:strand:- start:1526 stop:2005 length:480 start_codon:yes stop_codon:yes gene_type:complete
MFTKTIIDEETIELAKNWSDFQGNQFSIRTDGTKMIASNLAEIVFSRTYPEAIRISNTDYNADFIMKDQRVDVKCKERTVFCKEYYEVSVEARQIEYNADWYMFYSYNSKEKVMEFLGGIEKADYIKWAVLYRRGDIDPSNKWVVSVDCYNLKISELSR